MFPSQTSLIPVTVALIKFFQNHGFSAFTQNYPYWYLGSTPYKYLIGPIFPLLASLGLKLFPNLSLFSITIYFVLLSHLLAAIGWGLFIRRLSTKNFSILVFVFYLLFPWKYLSSLALSEASVVIAKSLLPFLFISFWELVRKNSPKKFLISLTILTIIFLTNTSVLPSIVVGLTGLILAASYKKGRVLNLGKKVKIAVLLLFTSLVIATFWYTHFYWSILLSNPSLGGQSSLKVFLKIFDLLKNSLPFFLAIFVVYFSKKIKKPILIFSLIWTFTFLFLKTYRFLMDVDFWQDWTSWFFELEIGVTILASVFVSNLLHRLRDKNDATTSIKMFSVTVIVFVLPFIVTDFVYEKLGRPPLISSIIPEAVESLQALNVVAKDERVFLSGSTVFWANAFYDMQQVRGGRDQVAVDADWAKAAWEFREGKDLAQTQRWLEKLDVVYVLVHKDISKEYYHDFKNIGKWEKVGKKIFDRNGDVVYKVRDE
jgi:hypothetical protein